MEKRKKYAPYQTVLPVLVWSGRVLTGGTNMPIGSQYRTHPSQVEISNGESGKVKVTKGSRVDLLPVEKMNFNNDDNRYFAEQHYGHNRRWLGKGPFIIISITRWPCGRVMIYLHCPNSDGAGIYAKDLMAVQ